MRLFLKKQILYELIIYNNDRILLWKNDNRQKKKLRTQRFRWKTLDRKNHG